MKVVERCQPFDPSCLFSLLIFAGSEAVGGIAAIQDYSHRCLPCRDESLIILELINMLVLIVLMDVFCLGRFRYYVLIFCWEID